MHPSLRCICLLAAGVIGSASVSHAIELTLKPGAVMISEAPANGTVALVGVDYAVESPVVDMLVVVEAVPDEGGVGSAELAVERGPGEVSAWLAVSAETGDFGVAGGTADFPAVFKSDPGLYFGGACSSGCFDVDGHVTLHLILFRQGQGVWHQILVDGGLGEGTEEADGRARLEVPTWTPVIGAPGSPGDLQLTDVLFALDPANLEVGGWLIGGLNETF